MRSKGRASWVAGLVALALLLVSVAKAEHEDWLEEARKQYSEATPFVEKANDTDVDLEKRKQPRKDALVRLKKARELYNDYLDLNDASLSPSLRDKIASELKDVNGLIFWLKKESSIGDDDDKPTAPANPAPPTDKTGPTPAPPVNPGAAEPPPKNEAPSDFAFRAKKKLAAIEDYEKAHSGDLPQLKQFYEQFVVDFPDTSLPEFGAAVERLGKINDTLKNVLKTVAKRDPDSFKGDDSAGEKSIFGKLSNDFNGKDPEQRRRAAKLIADSRVRSAAHFLAKGLFDKDDEVARICKEGLIAVGGANVGQKLVEFYRDASKEKQQTALEVLDAITKKSQVDAAAQSDWIGHFVVSRESDVAEAAIALLKKMGKVGGKGLMYGLDSKIDLKKLDCINALGDVKYYKAATVIGDRFLGEKVGRAFREAALDVCQKKMGIYCFPYLIPVMSNPWVPYVMNKIAMDNGEPRELFIRGDARKAREWWNAHKPKDAEED